VHFGHMQRRDLCRNLVPVHVNRHVVFDFVVIGCFFVIIMGLFFKFFMFLLDYFLFIIIYCWVFWNWIFFFGLLNVFNIKIFYSVIFWGYILILWEGLLVLLIYFDLLCMQIYKIMNKENNNNFILYLLWYIIKKLI
jgi:hypothetical protein